VSSRTGPKRMLFLLLLGFCTCCFVILLLLFPTVFLLHPPLYLLPNCLQPLLLQ
jgi:hypothetical protein